MSAVRARVAKAIEDLSPEVLSDPPHAQAFVTQMYQGLGEDASLEQKRHLTRRLAALARAWGIDLPLPTYMRPLRKVQPTRRADWAPKATRVLRAAACLDRSLSDRHGSADTFADRALASAILRCGLLRPQAWGPFHRLVSMGASVHALKGRTDLVWFDLDIPRQRRRSAQSRDIETIRVFPDTETLGLMGRGIGARLADLNSPHDLLARAMVAIGAADIGLSVDDIIAAGFSGLEDATPHAIPAILFEVARGAVPAFSPANDIWQTHLTIAKRDKPPSTKPAKEHPTKPTGSVQPPVTMNAQISLAKLCGAVMLMGAHAQKPTRGPIIKALEALLTAQPVPFVRGVALWLLDLLARKRAVGTIKRYVAAVRLTCDRMDTTDPFALSAGEIEMRLEETLELSSTADRLYRTGRLMQLFDFANADPRLRWPKITLDVDGDEAPCVRTALVGPKEIAAALDAFQDDPVSRAAVLLGARGGLRLSDMEALCIRDVERGADGMVCIHHTIWKSLKTPSARRMVPLAMLLTPTEQKIWDKFLSRRLSEAGPDTPLLAEGGGLLPLRRFDRAAFAMVLRNDAGLRPHDLRHGALSNLALVLLAPPSAEDTIHYMTGWREKQQTVLRETLTASDPWRGMKELARIAGHFDPATTLESYVHICDLALGLHVQACAVPQPPVEAARRVGAYSKIFGRGSTVTPRRLREIVLARSAVAYLTASPVQAVVVAPPPALGIELILKIDTAIRSGSNAFDIAQKFQLPVKVINAVAREKRIRGLRAEIDHITATQVAIKVFSGPEAYQWAMATMQSQARGIVFRNLAQAKRWLSPIPDSVKFRAELRTERPKDWDMGTLPTRRFPNSRKRAECLTLIPIAPSTVTGMALCQCAARMVLAAIAAQKALA